MASMRPCPQCTRMMDASRRVCAYCQQAGYTGEPALAPAAPASVPPSSRGPSYILPIVLTGVAGVVLCTGIVAFALKRLPPGAATGDAGSPGAGGLNITMLQSAGGRGGGSVLGAPAVDARQIDERLLHAAAAMGGDLEVSLAWNSLSDLDLEARDPAGELVNAYRPHSSRGGVQDVDANPTLVNEEGRRRIDAGQSPGPENVLPVPELLIDLEQKLGLPEGYAPLRSYEGKAAPRFTRKPVEHIYFAEAPKGTYTVNAGCYSWRESSSAPLPFTIQVRSRGVVIHQTSSTIGPASFVTHRLPPLQVCQFVIR